MATNLRFRHIEAFRGVMISGTITGAAAMLNVTQPAVSHLVHEMEDMLGLPLFDRRSGRIVATANAERLYAEIERCFLGLDHINDFCARLRASVVQTIMVAAVPVVSLALLPQVIRAYHRRFAEHHFSVQSRITEDVIAWVTSQKVDIGFAVRKSKVPGVHAEPIGSFSALCAVPLDHPLAVRDVVTVHDLADQPFITMARSEGVRPAVEQVLAEHGVMPRLLVECPMVAAACAMVDAGVGLTLVDPFAAHFARHGRIAFRRFEPAVPIVFEAYWLESRKPTFPCDRVMELVKAEVDAVMRFFAEDVGAAGRPRT
ncbi:MAG: LysR family transcriptional regulator [Alphaproteobacteria bacterium]|nr:LysR family transcriptional regulator [Alphaproteobacteria bacterium]